MKKALFTIDEATDEGLKRLTDVWEMNRSAAIRRAVKASVDTLTGARSTGGVGVSARTGRPVEEAMKAEPRVVVATALPTMMTGRQLAQQQARDRERRRGDETDQRGNN